MSVHSNTDPVEDHSAPHGEPAAAHGGPDAGREAERRKAVGVSSQRGEGATELLGRGRREHRRIGLTGVAFLDVGLGAARDRADSRTGGPAAHPDFGTGSTWCPRCPRL
ncbi:MAG: hypothetical protein WKH64_16320 [Chloroflexia bacterium]